MRTLSLAFDPFGDGRINLSAQARAVVPNVKK